MKSFLQEIESKFVELEEQDNKLDKAKELQQQLAAVQAQAKDARAATDKLFGEEVEEEIDEAHCGSHDKTEEIDEASNTGGLDGGAGPPRMKHAFSPADEDTITQGGYSKVQEAMDRKYERLIESYTKFSRGDKKITPENKVKRTIQEVSKKLKEIEMLVKHTSKLKIESGISRKEYGPRTEKALNKISEKLIKIAERVRAIGE